MASDERVWFRYLDSNIDPQPDPHILVLSTRYKTTAVGEFKEKKNGKR